MSNKVIPPGRDLVEVARGLEKSRKFPYQWSEPGPNSKPVPLLGSVELTADPLTFDIVSFEVPAGMIFSLTGFVFGFSGSGWTPFSSQLTFGLFLTGGVGNRGVDYLSNFTAPLGSLGQGPFPVPARLEFLPGNVLTWRVTSDGTILGGTGQNAFAMIYGHLYPFDERI